MLASSKHKKDRHPPGGPGWIGDLSFTSSKLGLCLKSPGSVIESLILNRRPAFGSK